MIISIDHGNKQIKTLNRTFTSGLYESESKPAFGEDVLYYNGKYYVLSEERIPYMRDKTKDNRFFILTLFAIAYEIEAAGKYSDSGTLDIKLNVGLPPSHYSGLYEKYEDYFRGPRRPISFTFREKPYSIFISEVNSYPQAYAAAMTVYGMIRDLPRAFVVDIGGFTADYLLLKKGNADLSVCDSLEHGVILLYNAIKSKVNADFDLLIDESDIDSIIKEEKHCFPQEIVHLVDRMAAAFVNQLFGKLRERLIDLRVGKTIFIGGGSILLRKYIESSVAVSGCIIIDDIAANEKGYDLLYRADHRKGL